MVITYTLLVQALECISMIKMILSVLVGSYLYPQDDNTSTWSTQSVTVFGNYAYVPSWRQPNQEFETDYGGMTILDITDKTNPQLVSHTNIGNGYTHKIHIVDSKAYVAANSGIYVFDVSSPASPILLGSLNPIDTYRFQDIYVEGNYAYLACFEKGFVTLDISDPSNITETGSYSYQSYYNIMGRRLNIHGDFIQIAGWNSRIARFNKSQNPSNPTNVNFFQHPDYAVNAEGDATGPRFRGILSNKEAIFILLFNTKVTIQLKFLT